uniref:HIG1 domain-containing protein n=1 Tax=Meloidogyne incognita TaxID=6306 RepID=A0A914MH65_MELIC
MTSNIKLNSILRMSGKLLIATAPVLTTELKDKDDKTVQPERHPRNQRTFNKIPNAPNTSIKMLTPEDLNHEQKKGSILTSHPVVLGGAGLTVAALMYMIRSSIKGDGNAIRLGAQYRIAAQLATFAICFIVALSAAKTSMAKEK